MIWIIASIAGIQLAAIGFEIHQHHYWGATFWIGCLIANIGVLGGMTK